MPQWQGLSSKRARHDGAREGRGAFRGDGIRTGTLALQPVREVFTAPAPDGVGLEKYDETVAAMLGMLRYGSGLPMHRIQKLQHGFRIPLPVSTQWEILLEAAGLLLPAHVELASRLPRVR